MWAFFVPTYLYHALQDLKAMTTKPAFYARAESFCGKYGAIVLNIVLGYVD